MKNEIRKVDGFGQQVVLYAKGWYGRSGNGVIPDLTILLAEYSGNELEFVSKRDVWEILCRIFGDCVSGFDVGEALYETVGGKWEGFNVQRKPEDVLIGKLSIIDGGYVDKSEKMDFRFQKDLDTPTE